MIEEEMFLHTNCWVQRCVHFLVSLFIYRCASSPLHRYSRNCDTCTKPILPGQASTRALFPTEKFFHRDCFLCTACNKGIAESEFIDVDGKQCATTLTKP